MTKRDTVQQARASLGKHDPYVLAKTRQADVAARTGALRLAREQGRVVDVALVVKAYHSTVRPRITALRGLARKLAPRMARETDATRCEHIMLEAIDETLRELSDYRAIEADLAKAGIPEDLGQGSALANLSGGVEASPEDDGEPVGRTAPRAQQRKLRKSGPLAQRRGPLPARNNGRGQ